ncbi:MAG: PAS domain S-box protein [Pseudomonadota bacterium]
MKTADLYTNKSLSAILNHLSDAFMVMDNNGRVNYFNTLAEQITGYSAAEARKMTGREILRTEGGHCQDNCPFNSPSSTRKTSVQRELLIRRKDSSRLPVECTTSVLIDDHGMIIGAVDVFKDISRIKGLEDELRNTEFKYRRLFEGSKDMIFITSATGGFLDVNPACVELLGYDTKQDLFALASIQLVFSVPVHWKVFKTQIDRNGFVKDFEAGFRKIDGTRLHCLLSGNAVKDNRGIIIGYEGIAKDITARMDAFRSLYRRNEELQLLNTVAVTMNSAQDLDQVLPRVLVQVMELLKLDIGAIVLINPETRELEMGAWQGLPEPIVNPGRCLRFHDEFLREFLLKKESRLTPTSTFPSFRVTWEGSAIALSRELTCFLITSREKPCGFLAFHIPGTIDVSLDDTHLIGSLGNFLGGAIENLTLIRTVQRHSEELKGLTAQMFQSREIECRRISRELHDEAGQALIGINFTLETVEKNIPAHQIQMKNLVSVIKGQINHTYEEMRRISHRLHPALLTDMGLEPALDAYMNQMSRQGTMDISYRMIGFSGRVHPDIETVLFRFSQEALSNAIKHARATRFKISIIRSYPRVIFVAEDNGIGFDPQGCDFERPALGLLSMRERASLLGGTFALRTARGNGTLIRIEIPLRDTAGHIEQVVACETSREDHGR